MALPNLSDNRGEPERRTFTLRRIVMLASAIFAFSVLAIAVFWAPTLWQVLRERNPTLGIPPHAGGLDLDTSDQGKRTAEGIADALSVPIGFQHVVAGTYKDPAAAEKSAILMAGSITLFHPAEEINQLFAVITDTSGGVTQTRAVNPGPLGGKARCGLTSIDAAQVPVCAWADHGSAGLILLPGHTAEQAAKRFPGLRAAVQKR